MSRRGFNVDGKDVIVGWDGPIETFFGDIDGGRSTTIDGGRFDIHSVDELAKEMGVDIPVNIRILLAVDQAKSPPPTVLQADMRRFLIDMED